MTTTDTVRSGVWTPWAEALCPDCHRTVTDAQAQRIQVRLDADEPLYDTPTQGLCTTNPGEDRRGCGAPIWLPPDVAPLTRIKAHFPGAELEQTGGMCSALLIPSTPDGPVVIVTALDGPILMSTYASREAWQESWEDGQGFRELPEDTPDEVVIATIQKMLR